MKKIKFNNKVLILLAVIISTIAIVGYSKPILAQKNINANIKDSTILLNVEKKDKDTVIISVDNFRYVPKSMQLSLKIDGNVSFKEDTIKWLVKSDSEKTMKNNAILSDNNKVIDLVMVSNGDISKDGGKIELLEVDVEALSKSNSYNIVPNLNIDGVSYNYILSSNNKQEKGTDIANVSDEKLSVNSEPIIALISSSAIADGNIIITRGSAFEPKSFVIAKDDEDGEIKDIKVESKVNVNIVGSYAIKYTATDSSGDSAVLNTTVIVEGAVIGDVAKPEISGVHETVKIKVGESFNVLDGVTASDYSGRRIEVVATGSYDSNAIGEYAIKYNATDRFGNKADEKITNLIVSEDAKVSPLITGVREEVTIMVGEEFKQLEGVKATDYTGKNIEVIVSGDYDIKKAGTYTIKYNAVDNLGNQAIEKTTKLNVKEEVPGEPPVDNGDGEGEGEKPEIPTVEGENSESVTEKPSDKENKLPATGKVIGGTLIIILGGALVFLGNVLMKRRNKK